MCVSYIIFTFISACLKYFIVQMINLKKDERSIGQETQAPGQLDLLPEGECSDGSLEGDRDGPVAQVELAERHLAGLGRGQVSVGEPSGPRAAPKP